MASKKFQKQKGQDPESASSGSERQDEASREFFLLRWRRFFQEVMGEFGKIVWPARKVTLGLTGFVLILVIFLSFFLGSVDVILGKLVTSLLR